MAVSARVFISHTSDMAEYPDWDASFVRAVIDAVNRARLVPGAGPARATLPAGHAVFVGRGGELERIVAAISDAAEGSGVVAIPAIDGMPGIGKTALAVRAAHRLAGRFLDRRLFVDLHGHTPGHEPTDPTDALADPLRADGLDPRQLPDGMQARSALRRDRMSGKRALLVLDNVRSTAQVRPLLPGTTSAPCTDAFDTRHGRQRLRRLTPPAGTAPVTRHWAFQKPPR